jgi:transmembrane sensor
MDDLSRQLTTAREELEPQWNVERSARLFSATRQRGRLRTVQRAGLVSVVAMAAVVVVALGLGGEERAALLAGAAGTEGKPGEGGHTLRLADGSHADLVGAHSELELVHNTKERVALRLVAGRAHFEVRHDPARSFVVEAGAQRVEVIGTSFDVERDAQSVAVSVMRGKVRVYGPAGATDVSAGETKRFAVSAPTAQAEPAAAAQPEPETAAGEAEQESEAQAQVEEAAHARSRAKRSGAQPSWRSLTQSGQYDAAFAAMLQTSGVDDDPAALMDAADAARLSGHPQNAVQYLGRVVRDHGKSPVAPLAAFTLGRVYLDKLGQPDKAATAFERARALSPAGSLAQDALAREVEALSKGGNAQKAYLRAQEYLRQYPNGRRLRAVQLYGGILE